LVAVVVRDDHDIDGVAIDARRRRLVTSWPAVPLLFLVVALAGAGIDHRKPRSGIDRDRVVRRVIMSFSMKTSASAAFNRVLLDVGDVILRHLEAGENAVGGNRDLDATDLVAVQPAACLPATGVAARAGALNAWRWPPQHRRQPTTHRGV